ncbi:hypothetical protein [Sphingomonas morindae]|uniref:Uncharacterized protein n=1 Tax=Sphingomonas morindae TaxID=1541170 RepID=A0ABY4XA26_9SPHN|nr:hypothetical protein [Sphingomonas morindae]USI72907.1 hypothetical protein LHA26_16835 [Sphingomonas morindae]USI73596.1 hypothetical protein LHA26_03685 [Sphingomonas morindae]
MSAPGIFREPPAEERHAPTQRRDQLALLEEVLLSLIAKRLVAALGRETEMSASSGEIAAAVEI